MTEEESHHLLRKIVSKKTPLSLFVQLFYFYFIFHCFFGFHQRPYLKASAQWGAYSFSSLFILDATT